MKLCRENFHCGKIVKFLKLILNRFEFVLKIIYFKFFVALSSLTLNCPRFPRTPQSIPKILQLSITRGIIMPSTNRSLH